MSKSLREILGESCGLAVAINIPNASEIVRDMLLVQQHRGQAGAGIVSSNHHNLHLQKNKGRVNVVFPEGFDYKKLPGKVAMGHNRYATRGSVEERCNVQPLLWKVTKYGQMAVAHNGQLIDVNNVKTNMIRQGTIFQSTTDSETIAHLVAQSKERTIEAAIESEIKKVPLAYSLMMMNRRKVIALRDQYGVRPLAISKLGDGYLVASETTAFRIFPEAEFVRHVKPGEMVVFDKKTIKSGEGFESIQFAEPKEHWCIFEGIYFSDPRSDYNDFMHEDFRQMCGAQLYEENKEFFDDLKRQYGENVVVVPILDSGKQGAIGFQKASGIPYKEYLMRRHNAPKASGRSYTAARQSDREDIADMKLDVRKAKVKGRVIITIDDSIVRGTTTRRQNKKLRDAGAEMIVNGVLSPMLTDTCRKGMDHQTRGELIAYRCGGDPERISHETGSNSTIYLSLPGLNTIVDDTYKCGTCSGCFGGVNPAK